MSRLWPRPISMLFRVARWAGVFWLIYHGALVMPVILVAASVVYWSAEKTHKRQRGEA
ncbi:MULTISPECIES: hypothetical protein [unclassified Halomonas]|uniref:hypothetical protein n=1 Tax=unclassified Halomonas TaxID=2609666 RepID=UPI0020767176|nr:MULTISPECIES: hypothetical protein [unclassified Halomonas]